MLKSGGAYIRCLAFSLLWGVLFSLGSSVLVCVGIDPETRWVSDSLSPLLGIWCGTSLSLSKVPSAKPQALGIGAAAGMSLVLLWLGFWLYVEGRLDPIRWWYQAFPRLSATHFFWWAGAVSVAMLGAFIGANAPRTLVRAQVALLMLIFAGAICLSRETGNYSDQKHEAISGYELRKWPVDTNGTVVRLLSFDFTKQPNLEVGIYDCARDESRPDDDANTTYMGQSLSVLVARLTTEAMSQGRQLVCVCNGGFFGAQGLGVAHHEEPIVQSGQAHYLVDLMRPREQTWFFAFQPLTGASNQARFQLLPRMSQQQLEQYGTVLGGVRPLRVKGESLALTPGAGGTKLRCSRTSVGWSADGNDFFILNVFDPDSEGASHLQQRMGWRQTGGWDVQQIQKFWEDRQVPFAVLFDGGESTQLAFRNAGTSFSYVPSGYQYSFTVGYLFQRPIQFTLPILPPDEAHRGVLNYVYVTAPR